MTTNSDIVRDILLVAYEEIQGRELLSSADSIQLDEFIESFTSQSMEERKATLQELQRHQNRQGGWSWVD